MAEALDTGKALSVDVICKTSRGLIKIRISAESVTTLGEVARDITRDVCGTVTAVGKVARDMTRDVCGTVTTLGEVARDMTRDVCGTVITLGEVARDITRDVCGTATTLGEVARDMTRDVGGTATTLGKVARDITRDVCITAVSLGALYVGYKLVRPLIETAVRNGLGGERDDQEVRNIRSGSLHVELHCLTNERFLEVLADYESGSMKERLQKEFFEVGIKVEGLKVEIENMEEVNKMKEAIIKGSHMDLCKDIESIEIDDPNSDQEMNAQFDYPGLPNEVTKHDEFEKVQEKSRIREKLFSKKEKDKTKKTMYNDKIFFETSTKPTQGEILHNKTEEGENSNRYAVIAKALQYRTLLKDLNLESNSKLTLKKVRTVDNRTLKDDKLTSPHQIPGYILNRLMIFSHTAREFELKSVSANQHESKDSDSDDSDSDGSDVEYRINPMDAFLAIFHCSDDFLRRDIVMKLSACQLSVPFLLPDPVTPSKNVTILLTALRSITKSWKGTVNDSYGQQHVFATEFPFPVVSFIRIGKNTISKSSLMNKIMSSRSEAHDVFFHKDVKGGDVERKIVDGLVELAWYLPSGAEEEMLQNGICFANLRGDGGDFKKQLDIMTKISSVLCLLLTSEYPDETKRKILDMATNSQAKTIIIFNEKTQKDVKKYFNEFREKNREKLTVIAKANRSYEHDFVQRIREKIQKNINTVKAVPLVELASHASEYDILLDGSLFHSRFEEKVNSWLKMGAKEAKDLLKLQKHVPILADLEREIYCPTRNNKFKGKRIERAMDEIYAELEEEKNKQKHSFNVMDKWVIQCLNDIAQMDESDRNYALAMLKHQLNNMSLQIMATLHEECYVSSINLQAREVETRLMSKAISSEEEHLKQTKESISKCSFGLEHIFRELAQLYQISNFTTIDYAGAAAEMLLSGHPFELIDGDSFYVPLQWFDAVFAKLENKTNNAKIFVISVLGIESSGKSTMLNTMFGLELPVSVGKCTRGAFASLIPVSDSLKTASEFDYVLIIDTEGLRGSGDPQLRERDNELTTFAIGVADVTIVNIFGYNHNEIKKFLEITVHAFLKMKLVKEKKVCKIIHQNVLDVNAASLLKENHVKLKEELDKMAKIAANLENCENQFQKFNDIISFDENKDVFYIRGLLKGCSPMAPVSPNYGEAIQRVKEDIISLMSSSSSQSSISQFRERVIILWKAMLKETFIFSFRNTIEVRAYTALDRKYFEESMLMVIKMGELEESIQVALTRCTTQEERVNVWKCSKELIHDKTVKLGKQMEKAIENFFETDEDKSILEQWREDIMKKIELHKKNLEMEATTNCNGTFNFLQERQDVNAKKQIYEKRILKKAREFITAHQNMKDVSRLNEEFEHEWEQWIKDVPGCEEHKLDVNKYMVHVLSSTDPELNTKMGEKLDERHRSIIKFMEIVPCVDKNQLNFNFFNKVRNYLLEQQQQFLYSAKEIKDQAVNEGINFAKRASKSSVRCRTEDLTQMFHVVITKINKETEKHCFKFCNNIKCDILLHTFARAYKMFDEMEERYFEGRNIRGNLEKELRPKLEKYVLNLCSGKEKDIIAAILIVDVLRKPIESKLNRVMGPAFGRELSKHSEYKSRDKFHASVLIQLGQEANFQSYIPYLDNPAEFLRNKLKDSIENFCLQHAKTSSNSLLKNEAKKIEDQVLAAISTATEKLKESENKLKEFKNMLTESSDNKLVEFENKKLSFWIQQFVEACFSFETTKEMFAVAAIDENLQDISAFEGKVYEHVTQFIQSLIDCEVDRAAIEKWNPSAHDYLFTSMFGCQSLCPFCKSLCDQSVQNHAGSHFTRIHRPLGLTGDKCTVTGKLTTKICTTLVAGTGTFQNADTSNEKHPYKDYKTVNDYYDSWLIVPDSSVGAPNYWQWFVAKFSKQLAEHYDAKEPDISLAWKFLSFKDVKEQLERDYTS